MDAHSEWRLCICRKRGSCSICPSTPHTSTTLCIIGKDVIKFYRAVFLDAGRGKLSMQYYGYHCIVNKLDPNCRRSYSDLLRAQPSETQLRRSALKAKHSYSTTNSWDRAWVVVTCVNIIGLFDIMPIYY